MPFSVKGNILRVYFFLFLILLLFSGFSRIFLYLINTDLFSGLNLTQVVLCFLYGLRFDMVTISWFNMPVILLLIIPLPIRYNTVYQRVVKSIFCLINSAILTLNIIDSVYFRFTLRRTTGDIFQFIHKEGATVYLLIPEFIRDYWQIVVFWMFFIALFVFVCSRFAVEKKTGYTSPVIYITKNLLYFLFFSGLTLIGARGGVQLKPLNLIDAGKYGVFSNSSLILNTPFSIIKTYRQSSLKKQEYFSDEKQMLSYFNALHEPQNKKSSFHKLNVLIIILESFSAEHTGFFNRNIENYQGYTPFLDSLMQESLVFKAFANGKRSIEAVPAIISSLPSLMNTDFTSSVYATNKINSLPGILREKGYTTSFYHGGKNGTMSFESFSKHAGIENYYGLDQYPEKAHYDGRWGIFDEEFLQFAAKNINQTQTPFFACIFTLSSHHPYTIPAKHKNRFAKGGLPIHESIRYADYALKHFFDTISRMPWFGNTLFVITSDHSSETQHEAYQNKTGRYAIPLIFYKQNSTLKGYSKNIAQQADVMPSILDYLNYDQKYIAFGNSVFNPTRNGFAISYTDHSCQWITDSCVLYFSDKGSCTLYNFIQDPQLTKNIAEAFPEKKYILEQRVKSFIQQYNTRLIENTLTIH